MDTLVDEFDPIRSLDAFGMHVIEDNPGVKEALSAREHSIAIRINEQKEAEAGGQSDGNQGMTREEAYEHIGVEPGKADAVETKPDETSASDDSDKSVNGDADADNNWPYGSSERKTSKEAWWRTLGRGRKRDMEGK